MNILVNIILLVVLILIAFIIYYLVRRKSLSIKGKRTNYQGYPPEDYMVRVGAQCPDYWSSRVEGTNVVCENTFNIPVNNKEKCLDKGSDKTKTFGKINKFPLPSNNSDLRSRCNWIKECGAEKGSFGSWIDLQEYC